MSKVVIAALAIIGLIVLPNTSAASAITGVLDIAGAVRITNTGTIDWGSNAGTTGVAAVQNTSTLRDGPTLINTGTATLKDLTAAGQPTTGFPPLDLFLTLSAAPTVDFVLGDINACTEIGGGTTCNAGATSPLAFSQTLAGDTTVTLRMSGTVFDTLTPALVSNWIGIYTLQFPAQTIAQLLAQLTGAPGFIDSTVSASLVTIPQAPGPVVPEPASFLLLGTGALGLIAKLRNRRKKTQAQG